MTRFEETLDPENWDDYRLLGHQMLDDMFDYLQNIRDEPCFQLIPEKTLTELDEPLPKKPQGATQTYEDFKKYVYGSKQTFIAHPRYWGWVNGTGTPMGMLADMLAAGTNNTSETAYQMTYQIEMKVLDWFKEMLNYPKESSGILVSGCSMANLTALTVARNKATSHTVREEGLIGYTKKLTLYCSEQVHDCIYKNMEILGLGKKSVRKIPVDSNYRMQIPLLEKQINEDRRAGFTPFCVVGTAGSVNTGAIDDLEAISRVCKDEDLWFHVDAAFGAWAMLSETHRDKVKGLGLADSVAVDLHKWMYMPYGIGFALVRSRVDHLNTFSMQPPYLGTDEVMDYWLSDLTPELSRGFRALKAWMMIKEQGADKFGRLIQQNIDQANYFGELVSDSPKLELSSPVSLNVVCFRYVPDGLSEEQLEELNTRIGYGVSFSGVAVYSSTRLHGTYVQRMAITNHRTTKEDLDLVFSEIIKQGDTIVKEYR